MYFLRFTPLVITVTSVMFSSMLVAKETIKKPKLILQITVDQLRADLPRRYMSKMGEGGFRYLYDKGIVYEDAQHVHANTETVVGHTTLATGAYPSLHGMVGNVWYDRVAGQMTYNLEDSRYHLLGKGADVDKKTEVDATQKVAKSDGRSPASILVSTFSDELSVDTNHQAKVFAVSVKDRGAIPMAGHAGKAFWFSKATGRFVTSSYYYDKYPKWVDAFNAQKPTRKYENKSWTLLYDASSYLFGQDDNQSWETEVASFGRVFPHAYGNAKDKYFTTLLTLSPAGDAMTLNFAKALIKNENLGQDTITDYLSVSFSSTDYVGHVFGPSSLEAEDNLLRLDKTLASLFSYIDKNIGLENTLIVLSADHGAPEAPPELNKYGIEAEYINPNFWKKEGLIKKLKKEFGVGAELVKTYHHPYIYLNHKLIEEKGLDIAKIETMMVNEIMKFKGVWLAVSSEDVRHGKVANTEIMRRILNNDNPRRSGDIFILPNPGSCISKFDGLTVASSHGTPWSYDSYVPVIFAGASLKAKKVYEKIETVDIARTLSAYMHIKAPSGANGSILKEVFDK